MWDRRKAITNRSTLGRNVLSSLVPSVQVGLLAGFPDNFTRPIRPTTVNLAPTLDTQARAAIGHS